MSTCAQPLCPRGHPGSHITKSGFRHDRQIYLCRSSDGTHRFYGPPPPDRLRGYEFKLQQAAQALAIVANGGLYRDASQETRKLWTRRKQVGRHAGLTAEWIDVFAPTIIAAYPYPAADVISIFTHPCMYRVDGHAVAFWLIGLGSNNTLNHVIARPQANTASALEAAATWQERVAMRAAPRVIEGNAISVEATHILWGSSCMTRNVETRNQDLEKIGEILSHRGFALRNQRRTDALCALLVLGINKQVDIEEWTQILVDANRHNLLRGVQREGYCEDHIYDLRE